MMLTRARDGYVFLVSVLAVGAIAIAVVATLLLAATSISRNRLTLEESARALAHSQTCAEHVLRKLRIDAAYSGNETLTLTSGSCTVRSVGGVGNTDRTVCVEGVSGSVTRRLEIDVERVYPSMRVRQWQEVSAFSLCP
ncbi:MAG: Uncharacterized protein G01um101425_203 [Candidatus Peregrinibacteria bacterium Gr01-1014_25]|nr:MAG: Uncharacterized protein G01um101425_203 [Candidatus Peregrinibacteria bacterium Gr01-1014_25]